MKRILMITTLLLVFTLTGCFGNYKEGYKQYSKNIGTYSLYHEDMENDEECPNEPGYLYTMYTDDGNTFKYKGIRTGDGCYVPLSIDTGSGFASVQRMLDLEEITISDLEGVEWTFNFVIEQTPDITIGSVNYIEYFQEIGNHEVYVRDFGETICHDMSTVMLFEYRDIEYDVLGAPSGDGCRSDYYVYILDEVEEPNDTEDDADADDDEEPVVTGELMTVNAALQAELITVAEINTATFESNVFSIYIEGQVMATSATLHFVEQTEEYNVMNPYVLSAYERNTVLGILATNRYRHALEVDDEETTPYILLTDTAYHKHRFQIFGNPDEIIFENEYPDESIYAILTLRDIVGTEYTYEIYPSGIRLSTDELNVYAEHLNQTFITNILDEMAE